MLRELQNSNYEYVKSLEAKWTWRQRMLDAAWNILTFGLAKGAGRNGRPQIFFLAFCRKSKPRTIGI